VGFIFQHHGAYGIMFIMFYPQKHVLSTKSVGTKNEDISPCQWKKNDL